MRLCKQNFLKQTNIRFLFLLDLGIIMAKEMSNNDGGPPLKKVRYDTEIYTYDKEEKILRIHKII